MADFDLRIPVASLGIRLVEPRSPQFRSFMDEVASYYTTTGVLVGKHVFPEFGGANVYSVLVPYNSTLEGIREILQRAKENIQEQTKFEKPNEFKYFVGYAGTLPVRLCRLISRKDTDFQLDEIQRYLEKLTLEIFGPSAVAIPSIVPTIDAFKQFIEQALESDKITRTGLSNLSSALAGMTNKICRILLGANRNCGNTGTRQENQEGRDMLIIGAGTMMRSLMEEIENKIITQFEKIIILDTDAQRAENLASLIKSKITDQNLEILSCTYASLEQQNSTRKQGGKLYILTALGGSLQKPHLAHIIELIRNYERIKFIMDDYPPHMLGALVRMIANPFSIPLVNEKNNYVGRFLDRIRVWFKLLNAQKISVLPRAKVDGIDSNLAGNLTLYPGCPKIKVYLSEIINKVINKLIHKAQEKVPTWACIYGVGKSMS